MFGVTLHSNVGPKQKAKKQKQKNKCDTKSRLIWNVIPEDDNIW